jgi:hypothetical protein
VKTILQVTAYAGLGLLSWAAVFTAAYLIFRRMLR